MAKPGTEKTSIAKPALQPTSGPPGGGRWRWRNGEWQSRDSDPPAVAVTPERPQTPEPAPE